MTETKTHFISRLSFSPDDYQIEAMDIIDILSKDENMLVTLPTGSGKTLIAEYAIWKAFKGGKRTIYTNPLKALSTEKLNEWESNYLSDLVVMRDTSDDIGDRTEENYGRFDVLITTNERLNSILRKKKQIELVFKDVEYVVIDEIHLLGSKGRGTTLEYIIIVLQEIMPHIKIIGLSATLPNYQQFAGWLNAKTVYLPPEERPVPLEHIYTSPVEYGSSYQMSQHKLDIVKNITRKYNKDQFLVFMSSRLRTEGSCKQMLGIDLKKQVDIKQILQSNVAYHHAGLDKDERATVEKRFMNGKIRILFATPTLAQGINLPVKAVILFDLSRWSIFIGDHELIEHYEVGQMNGRAGRRGFDKLGQCFYLGTEEEIEHAIKSVENPSDMNSRIYESLDEHILALRVSDVVSTQHDIENIFKRSFLSYQIPESSFLIPDEVNFLLKHNFLQKSQSRGGELFPTRFGSLTSKFYVKPRTVNEIYQNVISNQSSQMSEIDIIKSFLRAGEFLLRIRVGDRDQGYIMAGRDVLGLDPFENPKIDVTIYNPNENKYETMDLGNSYVKAIGLIFSGDLGISVFGSKKELYTIRKTASEIIQKTGIVLKTREEYREKMLGNEFRVIIASKMVEHGKLNPKEVYLHLIDGIGEERFKKLKNNGIHTLSEFFFAREDRLADILKLTIETILEMKSKSTKELPLQQLFQEELVIDSFDLNDGKSIRKLFKKRNKQSKR